MRRLALLLMLALTTAGCTMLGGEPEDEEETDPTPEVSTTPTASTTPVTTTPTATPTPPTPSPALDSSTYALAAVGTPAQAKLGTRWNFTLFANGTLARNSDHIGAHFADNDTTSPPVSPGRKDCEHVAGDLPGVFNVSCTVHDEGTWFVWGHARINDSGTLVNWWTPQPAIVKVRDYNLTLSAPPTTPIGSTQNFTFDLTIVGKDNATSDHIGIHYWNATTADPSIDNAAGACDHVAGGAVGKYTIKCAVRNSGIAPADFYLRGHLRLVEGATTLSWWSAETKVSIGPQLPFP